MRPGTGWRWARRATQTLAFAALVFGPLLGGWQRLDYTREASTWSDAGWSLASAIQGNLPLVSTSDALHQMNLAIGGGIAAELFSIPFMDPLAGTIALLGSGVSMRALVALAIPIGLALLAGRVFCGWFCVFGTLSRWIDGLCTRIRPYRFFKLPPRRPIRWLLLTAAVVVSLLGSHLLLYLLLPYLLLQQSVYAAWLLGGGSAVLGVLGGLLTAGVIFGPNAYCASLCPTGAMLSLLGRMRVLRLAQPEPASCGKHCDLCNRACWLQLDVRSGDPGPDCDLCGRCVPACPRSNLIATRSSTARASSRIAASTLLTLLAVAVPVDARAQAKPELIVDAELKLGTTTLAVSAIDFSQSHAQADWLEAQPETELSVFIATGKVAAPGSDGAIPLRDTYRGPLQLEVVRRSSQGTVPIAFTEPNSPMSAQRRRIYRARLAFTLQPGDQIRIHAVPDWLDETIELTVPERGTRISPLRMLQYFAASTLVFCGLLSLSFAGVDIRAASVRRVGRDLQTRVRDRVSGA